MGKKLNKRKREEDNEVGVDADPSDELDAEMAAVMEMRREKALEGASDEPGEPVANTRKAAGIYNKDALAKSFQSIGSHMPFVETLEICKFGINVENENEDLEREMAFYNQTLLAVKEGRSQLVALGVAVRRPDDFFCENVKSDAHMSRIKDKLILENKKMEAFEKRKERETSRKYEKQLADLRKAERAQTVKSEIKESQKEFSGRGQGDRNRPEKSNKRAAMDRKYGSGVKERMRSKMVDKKSLNDYSEYNPRGGKSVRRDTHFKGRQGGARAGPTGRSKTASKKPNRPGKEARTKKRAGN